MEPRTVIGVARLRVWTANNEVNISDSLFAVIKFAYPNPAVP